MSSSNTRVESFQTRSTAEISIFSAMRKSGKRKVGGREAGVVRRRAKERGKGEKEEEAGVEGEERQRGRDSEKGTRGGERRGERNAQEHRKGKSDQGGVGDGGGK